MDDSDLERFAARYQPENFNGEDTGWRDWSRVFCVGCAIVQADNAPDCGVAQGVVHGVTVRHGEKQEEEEGEVEQEVERNKEEDNNQTPVRMCMDGMR